MKYLVGLAIGTTIEAEDESAAFAVARELRAKACSALGLPDNGSIHLREATDDAGSD